MGPPSTPSAVASQIPARQTARVGPIGQARAGQSAVGRAPQKSWSSACHARVPGVVPHAPQQTKRPDASIRATAHSSSRVQARATGGGPVDASRTLAVVDGVAASTAEPASTIAVGVAASRASGVAFGARHATKAAKITPDRSLFVMMDEKAYPIRNVRRGSASAGT